jgi:hypothetical protein
VLKIIPVVLADTKYIICNTPTTPSRPVIHALQLLATCMPKYHKPILQRVKMGIFVHTMSALPSKFECNPNALIFDPVRHELSELHKFYNMHPKMEIFCPKCAANSCCSHPILDEIWKFFFPQKVMYKHYLNKYFFDFKIIITCPTVFVKNMNL